jgi:hypothetical protein
MDEQIETSQQKLTITEAKYITGYQIDNTSKTVDFEPFMIKSRLPNVNKYLDKGKFRKFLLVEGTLIWKNDEMTFSMDDLHAGELK